MTPTGGSVATEIAAKLPPCSPNHLPDNRLASMPPGEDIKQGSRRNPCISLGAGGARPGAGN